MNVNSVLKGTPTDALDFAPAERREAGDASSSPESFATYLNKRTMSVLPKKPNSTEFDVAEDVSAKSVYSPPTADKTLV